MASIILVRHATSVNNEEKRWNSEPEKDRGLSVKGKMQAERLAKKLEKEELEAIYSSPFPRCLQTAKAVNEFHGLQIIVEDRLREISKGAADGLTKEEALKKFGAEYAAYRRDRLNKSVGGGETYAQVIKRVTPFLEQVARKHCGKVLAVTHEAVIQAALAALFDYSYVEKDAPVPQATITRVKLDAKPVLELFADDSHLRPK